MAQVRSTYGSAMCKDLTVQAEEITADPIVPVHDTVVRSVIAVQCPESAGELFHARRSARSYNITSGPERDDKMLGSTSQRGKNVSHFLGVNGHRALKLMYNCTCQVQVQTVL